MTPKTIGPALDEAEWADFVVRSTINSDTRQAARGMIEANEFHAAAAYCLYGKDFGFTHDELTHLSHAIDDGERWIANHPGYGWEGAVEASRIVLDKLRALLPPPPSV